MKRTTNAIRRTLYRRVYPVETRRRMLGRVGLVLAIAWLGAAVYSYDTIWPTWIADPQTRLMVAGGWGLAGLAVPFEAIPATARPLVLVGGTLGFPLGLTLLGLLLAFPSGKVDRRIQQHALAQGRPDPPTFARRVALRQPGLPLVRVGRPIVGLPPHQDSGHIGVLAPTRSGKGLQATQVLLSWPHGSVVVDPKGELWERTAAYRQHHVGPVYCLPPQGLDIGQFYQLDDALERKELHRQLLRPEADRDSIFAEKSLPVFDAAAAVGHALDLHPLHVLAAWVNQSPQAALGQASQVPAARPALDRFLDGNPVSKPDRFTVSAWGTLTTRMGPLLPHLATWTTPNSAIGHDWAAHRATVYLCYPLEQLAAAGPLISALLAGLLRGQLVQPERIPTLFLIDELPAVGVQGLDTYLATVGGAGVTVLWYAQALTQLMERYGREGARSVMSNCHHQVFYPARDPETARYISEVFGTVLHITTQRRRTGKMSMFSEREEIREALSPADVLALPEELVIALTTLGGRQQRILAERLDPRRTFAHLPKPPTPPAAAPVDLDHVLERLRRG